MIKETLLEAQLKQEVSRLQEEVKYLRSYEGSSNYDIHLPPQVMSMQDIYHVVELPLVGYGDINEDSFKASYHILGVGGDKGARYRIGYYVSKDMLPLTKQQTMQIAWEMFQRTLYDFAKTERGSSHSEKT